MLIESEVRELASPGPVYCRVSMSPEGASITLITEPADSSIDQRGWVSRLFGRFYIISRVIYSQFSNSCRLHMQFFFLHKMHPEILLLRMPSPPV